MITEPEVIQTHVNGNDDIDKRPPPRPRKHPHLWQYYCLWDELMRMRQKHNLRISAAERGKSNLDPGIERTMMTLIHIDDSLAEIRKNMISEGEKVGPVWEWLTSIKGLGAGGDAAKLLAQIDDIGRFDTVSKLWRFAGLAVMEGKAEKNQKGEKAHFNNKLKAVCYVIADQFIKQQTPGYVDIYYSEKARQRELHPEKIETGRKTQNGKALYQYSDAHIHNRAWRKMIKEFLRDLWLHWRRLEGLPVSKPYAARLPVGG